MAERDRWLLWLPVLTGTGIGVYFALRSEPPLWLGPGLTALLAMGLGVASVAGRSRPWLMAARPLLLALLAPATGFAAVQLNSSALQTQMLPGPLGPVTVQGRVLRAEIFPDGQRLTLDRLSVPRLPTADTPARVRLRLRGEQPPVVPGTWIVVRAMLMPPPAPAVPSGFDYQRQAFFEGLGAVGYSVGTAAKADAEPGGDEDAAAAPLAAWTGIGVWFAQLRQIVNDRVAAHLDGPAAAVTMALLTGEQRAIPNTEMAAIRDSGLAHLLSISGLHIGLVAGFTFFVVRALLALIPPLALRFPIKKWAAVISVLGAGGYTLLADAPVPSQRSFFMIAIILLAVLVDRQGISLRLVAVAALAILLTQPAAMLGPSFQMSFAAVVALISACEAWSDRKRPAREKPSPAIRAALYLGGIVLSTLIAGLATAPFAAFHFNRFQVYSVAANMLAIPLTSFWVMPWAAVALVAMPLGLDGPALTAMSWGVDGVLVVAREVAAWPGAVVLLPPMPTWGLALISFGGAWLCLWRRRWRLLGLIPVAIGLAAMLTARVPDVFIDDAGKLVAVRGTDGGLLLSSRIAGRSARDAWLRRIGEPAAAGYWPKPGSSIERSSTERSSADESLRCDSLGCVFRVPDESAAAGRGAGDPQGNRSLVAIARRGEALADDCRLAQVVISLVPVRGPCPSAAAVIDRFDLWRNGAHVVWLGGDGVRVASVNGLRGNRPWVQGPWAERSQGPKVQGRGVRSKGTQETSQGFQPLGTGRDARADLARTTTPERMLRTSTPDRHRTAAARAPNDETGSGGAITATGAPATKSRSSAAATNRPAGRTLGGESVEPATDAEPDPAADADEDSDSDDAPDQ